MSVLLIRIPPGAEPPHIHSDGRIYRRVADSSDPAPEKDQSRVDRLADRAASSRNKLKKFVTQLPVVSKAEDETSYIHFSLMSDPYELFGHRYGGGFLDFVNTMNEDDGVPLIPFDNFFPHSDGFIARQIQENNPNLRVFTWEFHRSCRSFVAVPLRSISLPELRGTYKCGPGFAILCEVTPLSKSSFLDLNIVMYVCLVIAYRHRKLTSEFAGPVLVKMHLENFWRRVAFLNLSGYVRQIEKYGFPVLQFQNALCPPGTELQSFIVLPEKREQSLIDDAIKIFLQICRSLGITDEALESSAEKIARMALKASAAN